MALAKSNGHHASDATSSLDALSELYGNTFAVVKSMTVKAAMDLDRRRRRHPPPRRRRRHGPRRRQGHAPPVPCLRRLMRVLTLSGVFAVQTPVPGYAAAPADEAEAPVYALTPVSRLLIGAGNQGHMMSMLLHPSFVTPFLRISDWLQRELPGPTPLAGACGDGRRRRRVHTIVNDGMASDSIFTTDILVREHGEVFQRISSLVDVAGRNGKAAQAIARAFPGVKCSVMDLAHVVAEAPGGTGVEFIAGDMFESVPPALSSSSGLCMIGVTTTVSRYKILRNCKKAIPTKDKGGKMIIMDIVVGTAPSDQNHRDVQILYDAYIMFINGAKRDEQEWKMHFLEAGFSDYKIMPIMGFRSIIGVYP
uniref:O-methyltransferase C-terminal domain-containing protein n=1 Tax=Oryza meridionalis TaxID=40149 RepID=A0A0E0FBU0_9ORYZ